MVSRPSSLLLAPAAPAAPEGALVLADHALGLVLDRGDLLAGMLLHVLQERLGAAPARRALDRAAHALEEGDQVRGDVLPDLVVALRRALPRPRGARAAARGPPAPPPP